MDFRTRSARTGCPRRTPEVIFFAFSFNSFCRNSDTSPDFKSLVIGFKNSYPESVFIKLKNFCYKFPRPWNNFFFVIITERKVPEHLKEGMMSWGSSYIFYIRILSAGSCTFLARYSTRRVIR